MNYDEARQIEKSGKWNWTTMNDGVIRTAPPCFAPDFDWNAPDVRDAILRGDRIEPTGRDRCDHDTREGAERHYYDDQVSRIHIEELDLDTLPERRRCAFLDCARWEDYRAIWPDGYVIDSLCGEHAYQSAAVHPFRPGMQVIHS